jgi:hypothetical protein
VGPVLPLTPVPPSTPLSPMLIRYLISEAALEWSVVPGDVVDRPEHVALAKIAAGHAEAVDVVTPPPVAPKRTRGAR